LIHQERYQAFLAKKEAIEAEKDRLRSTILKPTNATVQELIHSIGGSELKDGIRASDLLKRPEMTYELLETLTKPETDLDHELKEQVEIQIKYEGYIEKSLQQVERLKKMEDKKIPENID
ncbi:tRNA uridine-5-carboxymethylaminomethyl(34) synthesis enzyme MnmG, partial [Alkalihalophilus pseudofirmus]|nr:tRNA uridine-5-carboxymethylaminomethyl(34) synthesis enzyme MnmG [Alkalihalophilus pseudofirmus]